MPAWASPHRGVQAEHLCAFEPKPKCMKTLHKVRETCLRTGGQATYFQ